MDVDTHDITFTPYVGTSATHDFLKYGTGGDCNGQSDGFFNINLTTTGFYIHPSVSMNVLV